MDSDDYRIIEGYIGQHVMAKITFKSDYSGDGWNITTRSEMRNGRTGRDEFCYLDRTSTVAEARHKIESVWNGPDKASYFCSIPEDKAVDAAYLPSGDNSDFYPTPDKLAGRMLGKVDWRQVYSILEPSAGKGDLIDAVKCFVKTPRYDDFRYTRGIERKRRLYVNSHLQGEHGSSWDIDCIERDYNLRLILRGKGCRLIGEDFLSFQSQKSYSLILMNPPFSHGAEHLLKAISMQKRTGGQIVCLLNAETILNPYSNIRKQLKAELAKLGASIEIVRDGFKYAERKTNVETAIVYIDIRKPARESRIFEEMNRAQQLHYDAADMEETALVYGDDYDQSIQHFQLEAKIGRELIEEYAALKPKIMSGTDRYATPLISLDVSGAKVSGPDDVEPAVNNYLRKLRYKYWKMFLDRPEIKAKMTSKMSDDYNDKLRAMRDYDYNRHNIMQLCFDIQQQLVAGVEESIMELFEKLSQEHSYFEGSPNIHYFNGWKTNKAWKVSNKAIIPAYGGYKRSVFKESWDNKITDEIDPYDAARIISDLEKSLNFLNKGEISDSISIERALNLAISCMSKTVNFKYFDVTFYKKGTAHIKFRPEAQVLLDRLNIFAARHRSWLPPSYGKKSYDDMTVEEQSAIDEFQGREVYEKVMAAPSKYILEGSALLQLSA